MRLPKAVVVFALVLAGADFVVRGPVRYVQRGAVDFVAPYIAARAWLDGRNPYSPRTYWDEWTAAGGDPLPETDDFNSRTAYPLSTFLFFVPVARLPLRTAGLVTTMAASLFVLAAIAALATLVPASRRAWFVVLALMLEPLHTGINTGNPAAMTVALMALGVWMVVVGAPIAGGVVLGLGLCLKPVIGIVAVAYCALAGRWRAAFAAAASAAAIFGVAALRLRLSGSPWLADYLQNNAMLFTSGAGGIIEGTHKHMQFVNLQFGTQLLLGDAAMARAVTLLTAAGLGLAWLWTRLRARGFGQRSTLAAFAALALLSLLPVYHRAYDAGLLLFPLVWACVDTQADTRALRGLTWILLVPFIVPMATTIEIATLAGKLPVWLTTAHWWNAFVVPHQAWTIVALTVVLLVADARTSRTAGARISRTAGARTSRARMLS